MNDVAEMIHNSKELADFISSLVDGTTTPSAPRQRLAGACHMVALDHHVGIVYLIERRVCAPALALLRPQYEAYLTGSWLLECASHDALENFTKRRRPTAETMVKALERSTRFSSGVLERTSRINGKTLHGLTHSGIEQAMRMMTEDGLERNYNSEELVEALNFSGAIALLAAHEVAMIVDEVALTAQLLDRCRQWAAYHPG
jgi:hypothetical protein